MKLYDILEQHLKTEGNYKSDDGELLKWVVINKAQNYDEELLELLLQNEQVKKIFFVEVNGTLVFKQNLFLQFLEQKNYLNDSYTQYKNKVGLTIDGKFLKQRNEVALVWPFKDCILEGGQSREEQKREEIFFNEILAQDEITQLLEPKVLTNAKVYDKDGEHSFSSFNRDAELNKQRGLPENTITDNLIIKGNNLLALHTLKKEFAGKVKLIYIDPPFNTGNDTFKYNDKFNHSAWLTFMKNRLEIAYELLKDDGAIFVHCDDNEQAYLKVLLDDIFGSDNFLNTLSVFTKVSAGASGGGEDKKLKKNIEYIHIFTKNNSYFSSFYPVYKKTELEAYITQMKQDGKSFKYTNVLVDSGKETYYKTIKDGSGDDIVINKVDDYKITTINQLAKEENLSIQEVYDKYFDKVMTTTNAQTSIRTRVWEATDNENNMYTATYTPKSGRNKGKRTKLIFSGKQKVLFIWLKDTAVKEGKKTYKKEKIGTFWDGFSWINVTKEGQVKFESGKKTEGLIQRVIEMASDENDIVLDFFMGSGTTQATALKMKRRFIGIEQMDYINEISVPRLQKVIDGEQGGISKDVNWQGGGSFVYAELFPKNMGYLQDVIHAKDLEELKSVYERMLSGTDTDEPADISFRADLSKIDWLQGFDGNKRLLVKLLDKNGLYYNYSEIGDSNVRDMITDSDYTFNKTFYEGGD